MKKSNNPLHEQPLICGAHARTNGQPCKNAPVTGSTRCRMHGGKRSGRPVVTGLHTNQAKNERRQIKELIDSLNEMIDSFNAEDG